MGLIAYPPPPTVASSDGSKLIIPGLNTASGRDKMALVWDDATQQPKWAPVGKWNPTDGIVVGDTLLEGYYAGTIDTTKGNIDPLDASQVGGRYVLVVSPVSLEVAGGLAYKNVATLSPPNARTRWDGLTATIALNGQATHPAADYCSNLPYSAADGGSAWYLPALDEMELIYRNLKPTTTLNPNGAFTDPVFVGGPTPDGFGDNPSSDPVGTYYLLTDPATGPAITNNSLFRVGGGQEITQNTYYWTSTSQADGMAWTTRSNGARSRRPVTESTNGNNVRPVRRYAL